MFQQKFHDIVVGLVGGEVEGGEELFVLVVQVAPLPAERLSKRLPLGKRRSDRTVESGVAGVGLLEVDHLGREELLESLRISLAATIKQAMSFEFTPKSLLEFSIWCHIYGGLAVAV